MCPKIGSIDIIIREEDVLRELQRLDHKKGSGPDAIPGSFLKNTAESLYQPLCLLFNQSLMTEYFPKSWKKSFLIPIFKSGARIDVKNYRGIAILYIIPKLFELLVYNHIASKVTSILHPAQHGFKKGCSTLSNLMEYCSDILCNMECGGQVDAIYFDFSKAFDQVDHDLLLFELNKYGLNSTVCGWLKSYLSGRTQFIKIDNSKSREISVRSGVPQGSHLGPLLFMTFINDLAYILNNIKFSFYADDLKVYEVVNFSNANKSLQINVSKIAEWCNNNGMRLNSEKCNIISFTRSNSTILRTYVIDNNLIKRVNSVKDLGIWLDSKMNFKLHIDKTIAKANMRLGLIKRFAKEFNDPYVVKSLYCSLVRSIMEYGSIIWMPIYDVDQCRIESVQKNFLLFSLRGLNWSHPFILLSYRARLRLLSMVALRHRQIINCCLHAHDVLNGKIISPVLSSRLLRRNIPYGLRHPRELMEEHHRTTYVLNEPINRCRRFYNRYLSLGNAYMTRNAYRLALFDYFSRMAST